MIKKILLVLVGAVVALAAALLFWPRWPLPQDHVAMVSLAMHSRMSELSELCLAGKPFADRDLQAAGFAPRFRPTVRRGDVTVPAEEIEEAAVRVESPQRLVLTFTLSEARFGFKPFFYRVSIPRGSTITLIAECKDKMIHLSTDRASTTVPTRYLTSRMREGLR